MKMILAALIISFLIFLGLSLMADKALNRLAMPLNQSSQIDWIVVLANGSRLTQGLKMRLDNAILAHQLWPQAKLLLTGDSAHGEISVMKDYLIKNNVSESSISEDQHSTSTWDSFKNIKQFIKNSEFMLIVTNEFHQRRAIATANLMGYSAALFGKDTVTLDRNAFYAIREQLSAVKWYIQYLLYKV